MSRTGVCLRCGKGRNLLGHEQLHKMILSIIRGPGQTRQRSWTDLGMVICAICSAALLERLVSH